MKYLLTESVKHLKIPFVKVEKKLFAEGELYIRIRENLENKPLIIISNITTDNFLEFLFTVDAAKRAKAKIKKIIIPFMSYARQDRVYNSGESVSGAVICSVLKNLKIPIKIIEIHNVDLIKNFGFENFSFLSILLKEIPKKDYIVVSPDFGGKGRAKIIADILGSPLVIIKKTRKNHILMQLKEKLPDKNILIVDDMISTGTTLIKASRLLKKAGAKEIYCISTHGLFVGDAKKNLQKSFIKKIFVSNTLNVQGLKQISVKKIEDFLLRI
ncbi:MAG: ribose-phosphate pyrophosphokinase, ribose-phosphate pyrophosphokinase [archaeon GW2011_AR13]|nr:MAG: ribose-phosphate pyrophosphokinase, ribose-phosphate pyrophosphokinase [archaeon GW2011_AR13]HIG94677.1 ribose-phosphate pyrophosphokinase [Nanoarchaeota archaeon]HIH63473.1 ribose-phosphate pyrophosphokinase [Nanoarchaeota archaeon]HIJ09403.1 ribose-phosphate pyrophosphokinase [Nanoarchaeota archaeon]